MQRVLACMTQNTSDRLKQPVGRSDAQCISGGRVRGSKRLLIGVLATWLSCASPPIAQAQQKPRLNWTSGDAPCAKYDDLLNPVLGNIGVRLDLPEPWAGAFRWALTFWNGVLTTNLYENTDLTSCAIRIVKGAPGLLDTTPWLDLRCRNGLVFREKSQ